MRKLPSLPSVFGFDPAVGVLDVLGVLDPGTSPADGHALADLIGSAAPPAFVRDLGQTLIEPLYARPPDAGATTPVDGFSSARAGPGTGGGGSGGDNTATQYASGSADGSAGYDILLQFNGNGWTPQLQQAFIQAADYLTTVITADIGGGARVRKVFVDDLYVTAELKTIDGAGGVLGQAGPSAVWSANELTAMGQMQFDVADAVSYFDKGLWDDIVTHELMHVLGFGSLWNYGDDPLVFNGQYRGAQGLQAYRDALGNQSLAFVPVEQDGGSGTAGSHWDEALLGNELMTGYIADDRDPATANDNYLSTFSVMSLADLGYSVAYQDYPYDATST